MKAIMEKLLNKDNLIPACFLILPFMIILVSAPANVTNMITIHKSHQFALFIFAAAAAAMLVKNKYLSAFMAYSCMWTLFILIYGVKFSVPAMVIKNAFEAVTFLLSGILFYILVINSNLKNETFYNIICISALIQSILALCQYLWTDPFLWLINSAFMTARPLLDPHTPTGTLGNNNFLAAYLAISTPFFYRKNWAYGLLAIIPCIILAKSTSAIIPAIIGGMFFFWDRLKWVVFKINIDYFIYVMVAIGGAYYALIYHPSIFYTSADSRWVFWNEALKQILFHPFTIIFGFGPGAGWGKPFPMHNEPLQIWHQYGIIGLSLFVGYVLTAYRKNRLLFAAFIIAIINMFGNYSLHLAPSAFLIILIAGMMEREKLQNG